MMRRVGPIDLRWDGPAGPTGTTTPQRPACSSMGSAFASGPRVALVVGIEQPTPRDMRIALRRGKAGVAEHLLDRTDVRPALQQVGGEGVPKDVWTDRSARERMPDRSL